MSETKDGGPAFPIAYQHADNEYDVTAAIHGMTLRDWFAGQALAGLCSGFGRFDNIAEAAYALADAMLAERERQK